MEVRSRIWERVKTLFDVAVGHGPLTRLRFLELNCSNPEIRQEVMRLVANQEEMGSFLSGDAQATEIQSSHVGPATTFTAGQLVAERFRIIRFIARGGMGEVYEALDCELEELVAIKAIRPDIFNPSLLHRFKNEVHLAKRVTHPNVCRVYDIFRHSMADGKSALLISMELLRGETLAQRVRRLGRLTTADALPVVRQIAAALESAHEIGILHRDLKPENVMLLCGEKGGSIRAVVMDFGVALWTQNASEGSRSNSATLTGTPAFMSPEQLEGGALTPASDIYAFGLLINWMLGGPGTQDYPSTIVGALQRISNGRKSVRELVHGLDDDVWRRTILRCLEREPSRRYQSAQLVVDALQPRKPIPAHRRGFPLYAAMVVLLFIIGVVGFKIWRAQRPLIASTGTEAPLAVAVLGFSNQTGRSEQAWLGTVLSSYLTENLSARRGIQVIPQDRVDELKRDLALTENKIIPKNELQLLRKATGLDLLLTGYYNIQQDRIQLSAHVQDARSLEVQTLGSEIGPAADPLQVGARIAVTFRNRVGAAQPTTAELEEARSSLPRKVEAMRLYAKGLDELRRFNALTGRDSLEQAIRVEQRFPLSHAALADAWYTLGYARKAAQEAKQAFDLSGELAWSTRLLVEARFREANTQWNLAEDVYRRLWSAYPYNVDYGLRVASAEMSGGRSRAALNTLQRLREANPQSKNDPRVDLAEAVAASDSNLERTAAERAIEKAQRLGYRSLEAAALREQGWALIDLDRNDDAVSALNRARLISENLGDRDNAARALMNLASALNGKASDASRISMNQQALEIFRQTGNKRAEAAALNNLAGISEGGHLPDALEGYTRASELFNEIGDQRDWATAIDNIGTVLQSQGDLAGAVAAYQQARAKFAELGADGDAAIASANLADPLRLEGRLADAAKACMDAKITYRRLNLEGGLISADICLAAVLMDRGELVGADELYRRTVIYFRRMHDVPGEIGVLNSRSLLLLAKGDISAAETCINDAIRMEVRIGHKNVLASLKLSLAQIQLEQGKASDAVNTARKGAENLDTTDTINYREAHILLARALADAGDLHASQMELNSAALWVRKTQVLGAKLDFLLVSAHIKTASSSASDLKNARQEAERALNTATKHGLVRYELESRLLEAQLQARLEENTSVRAKLDAIVRDSRAKGYGLIANKAAKYLASLTLPLDSR